MTNHDPGDALTTVHVYSAPLQPATKYVVEVAGERMRMTMPAHAIVSCFRCKQRRRASNAVVAVYYDGLYFYCADADACRVRPKRRKKVITPSPVVSPTPPSTTTPGSRGRSGGRGRTGRP